MSRGKYDIGYGKTPQATRFKPGQSGNPKGRPKGSKNLKTVVQQELNGPIVISERGRSKRVSRREALIKMLLNKGLKGDLKATTAMIHLDHLVDQDLQPVVADASLSDEDQAILEDFRQRLAATPPIKPEPEPGEES